MIECLCTLNRCNNSRSNADRYQRFSLFLELLNTASFIRIHSNRWSYQRLADTTFANNLKPLERKMSELFSGKNGRLRILAINRIDSHVNKVWVLISQLAISVLRDKNGEFLPHDPMCNCQSRDLSSCNNTKNRIMLV